MGNIFLESKGYLGPTRFCPLTRFSRSRTHGGNGDADLISMFSSLNPPTSVKSRLRPWLLVGPGIIREEV